ncbi:MAG: fucose isomerase [Treponema sp.]|jgi:L-fucose mutarotase|nr:fucose isomerase [Treponema sp.]
MGHGDTLVLADAFFPGTSCNSRVIRVDGIRISALLDGMLQLINLDSYVPHPIIMVQVAPGDTLDPSVELAYQKVIDPRCPGTASIEGIQGFAFYERSRKAYGVTMTGETATYGNSNLRCKGKTGSSYREKRK